MLSSRLNAFVMPTSQKIASGHATTCVWISCDARAGREHDHRGGDLQRELQLRRERTQVVDEPGDEEERDPGVDPGELLASAGIAPAATAAQSPTLSPAKMPTPPKSGVGTSCQRSLEGTATSRRCSRVARRSQIASAEAGRAAIAARVLTSAEGRALLLGRVCSLCVPTLVAADDGLRRPRSLPRAVREPLPPRLPGEVQGLGARRPLVAAQPARSCSASTCSSSASSSRARRSRTTRSTCSRASRAGSSSRPRCSRRRARSSTRRPDQEGALPAPARRVLDGRDAGGHVRGDGGDPDRPLARSSSPTRGRRCGSRSRWRSLFVGQVAGLALVVACLNVVFRDVEHILAAALLPWFFLTPILWSAQTLGDRALRHHDAAQRAALGEPRRAADLRDPRRDLVGHARRTSGTSSTSSVAAAVSLVLAALVFRSVDDRIAVEL